MRAPAAQLSCCEGLRCGCSLFGGCKAEQTPCRTRNRRSPRRPSLNSRLEPPPSGLYTASSLPRTYMGARRVPTSPHDDSSCSGSCARPRVKSNARIPRRSPARSSSLGFDCKLCIVQNADLPPRHPAVLSLAATTKSGYKPVNPGVAAPMGLAKGSSSAIARL